jgi:hypothetical protein
MPYSLVARRLDQQRSLFGPARAASGAGAGAGGMACSGRNSIGDQSSTFATLPLHDIFDPQGLVAALEAKGYVVVKPE